MTLLQTTTEVNSYKKRICSFFDKLNSPNMLMAREPLVSNVVIFDETWICYESLSRNLASTWQLPDQPPPEN